MFSFVKTVLVKCSFNFLVILEAVVCEPIELYLY